MGWQFRLLVTVICMYLKIRVLPENKEDYVREEGADTLLIAVREKAERGLANRRALQLLVAHFGKEKRVRIVSGHHSPHKIISVE